MTADRRGQTTSCDACSRQSLNDIMNRKQRCVHDWDSVKTLVCVIEYKTQKQWFMCYNIQSTRGP